MRKTKVPGRIPDEKALEAEVNAEMADYNKIIGAASEDVREVLLSCNEPKTVWRRHEAKGFGKAMALVKPKLEKKRNSDQQLRKRWANQQWTKERTIIKYRAWRANPQNKSKPKIEFVRQLERDGFAPSARTVYEHLTPPK